MSSLLTYLLNKCSSDTSSLNFNDHDFQPQICLIQQLLAMLSQLNTLFAPNSITEWMWIRPMKYRGCLMKSSSTDQELNCRLFQLLHPPIALGHNAPIQHFPRGTEQNHEKVPVRISRSSSEWVSLEYVAGLNTTSRRSLLNFGVWCLLLCLASSRPDVVARDADGADDLRPHHTIPLLIHFPSTICCRATSCRHLSWHHKHGNLHPHLPDLN